MRAPTLALWFGLGGLALAGDGAGDPAASITAEEIRAHVDFLASDLLEGRDSGHRGAELAALYVEAQLAARGFKPLLPTWQMEFSIPSNAVVTHATVALGGHTVRDPARIAALRYSGIGLAHGSLSLEAADPRDRVVVVDGDEVDTTRKLAEELVAAGARAVVFVSGSERVPSPNPGDMRRKRARNTGDGKSGGGLLAAPLAAAAEADALDLPVVWVNKELGAELRAAAEQGAPIDLEVTRTGETKSTNVLGWLPGSDPVLREEYVVVGAHYDHVGSDDLGNIWNGADDNASGTAALLEIADAIAALPEPPRRSVVLCAWSAEERGLLGSKAFGKSPPIPFEKMAAYFNMDMVGRNEPGKILAIHASDSLFRFGKAAGARHGLALEDGPKLYLSLSDTEPFVDRGVPTLFLFSGMHDDYHTPSDDPGTIDPDKAARAARVVLDVLLEIAGDDGRPDFTAPQETPRNNGRRLGFTQDTEYAGSGVRIQTVSAGTVAATAGLRAGDVIVRIGSSTVATLRELRTAIQQVDGGKAFEIEVDRGGEHTVLSATFED